MVTLHQLVRRGALDPLQATLDSHAAAINAYDAQGLTPLMYAAGHPVASEELARALLARGADVQQWSQPADRYGRSRPVLAFALEGGEPATVRLLLAQGAALHYKSEGGYTALHDALGRDIVRDGRLLPLLDLLLAEGVALDQETVYGERACTILSRVGRFDALRRLLGAGADPAPLGWSPLQHAVALGTLAEVEAALAAGAALEARDRWGRTAWLLALQGGEIARARQLLEAGANPHARGRCGTPPLFYAIGTHQHEILAWLLAQGLGELAATDEFGTHVLTYAAECDNLAALEALLAAGASLSDAGRDALGAARSAPLVRTLLEAGADPQYLAVEGRRALLGLPPDPDVALLEVSEAEFWAGREPRFGTANPTPMTLPFWEAMLRAGISAYQAAQAMGATRLSSPTWCAQRFGQSITLLPDGRIVQVGGEHEDYYDPDFYIYNDVIVHEPDGTLQIYGYPRALFPPTDFHSATRLGHFIYLIGNLGYYGTRRYGQTPVFRLDTTTFAIEPLESRGECPGWLYQHRARALTERLIEVTGGTVVGEEGEREQQAPNEAVFVYDVIGERWARVT